MKAKIIKKLVYSLLGSLLGGFFVALLIFVILITFSESLTRGQEPWAGFFYIFVGLFFTVMGFVVGGIIGGRLTDKNNHQENLSLSAEERKKNITKKFNDSVLLIFIVLLSSFTPFIIAYLYLIYANN